MAKLSLVKASTDVTLYVFIQDSSSTTGAGLTGLVYNSASLVCYYVRPLAAAAALTLATQTVTGAHSDGGFVEVSSANMPGWYRLDLSDSVCATGVNFVGITLKGATNMAPVNLEVQLTSLNLNDAVRGGMTALPNANADAAGGLIISDAGGLDADAQRSDVAAILVDTGTTLDGRIPAALVGGRMDANMGAISGDATAADDLESALDGTGGVTLTLAQLAFNPTGAGDCIIMGGSGSGNGIGFTRSGAGDVFDATVAAAIQAEANDAIVANHLDHLLATTYDPASKPGASDALLNELIESDAGVSRYTANALEQAPSGGGGTSDWTADERTAIRAILGVPASGTTPDDPTTGILDTIRDSVATRASQTSVDTIDDLLDTEFPALTTAVADLPTNAELATALAAADDAVLAAIAALNNLSAAQVNSEVVDALNVDTYAEISSIPAATTTLTNMIRLLFSMTRNKTTQTATTFLLRNDADSATIGTATVSDDGTTAIKGELA